MRDTGIRGSGIPDFRDSETLEFGVVQARRQAEAAEVAEVVEAGSARGPGLPRHWLLLLLGAAVLPGVVLVVVGRSLEEPAVQAWRTVCLAVTVQALPFLLLGTALSGAINAFVPASVFSRLLPKRPALAVPVAGAAGVVLPGCECASVPVANSLIGRGVNPAAAFAFLLSAPAINPVVLTATAVAFPGSPEMVLARLLASLVTAAVMGWLWLWLGREEWLRPAVRHTGHREGHSRWEEFRQGFQHDFLHAGGFLVVGAMAAATFNVAVPRSVLEVFSGSPWLSVLFLAALAILLAVCSEADAFVAASLSGFSPVARLAFMVVGPMVDLKLIALQAGTFGRAFAVRFSSATVVVAVVCSAVVGGVLL
ncbi:permease [Streptomyces sp. NPDC005811]|uniref:permease n=1 Tax=Streptomyces sp. NPDC005811 TaxID=3154565 RepID=UPI0033C46628